MKKTICIFIILVMAAMAIPLSGLPLLQLSTPQAQEMKVGDTFEVSAKLQSNDGVYSVFLDLHYDNTVFELQEILPGDLFPSDSAQAETLIARQPFGETGRLLISQSLIGKQRLLTRDGELVRFVFRAIGSAEASSIYLDEARSLLYSDTLQSRRASYAGLTPFKVRAPYTFFFVQILNIYNNYQTSVDKLDWRVQATISNPNYNDRFQVGLKRVDRYAEEASLIPGTQELMLTVSNGQAFFRADQANMFSLAPGINYVVATLYVNGNIKAATVKRVYYDAQNRGVKILSPFDNAIVSQHRIVVNGRSDFPTVTINNVLAPVNLTGSNQYNFQLDNFPLKEGFNKITAAAENPEQNAAGIKYTDTVVVYYQRDESLFTFIQPDENMVFKEGIIEIRGLIDTIDKEKVLVKMRAHFRPYAASINDYDYAFASSDAAGPDAVQLDEITNPENMLLSHYGFTARFDLARIAELGSGQLTLYALKTDKRGDKADLEITRNIVVDRSGLEIDLRQPNLKSLQVLGSEVELKPYLLSGTTGGNIIISPAGELALHKQEQPRARLDPLLKDKNVQGVVVTGDHSNYAIVNLQNRIEIYKREAAALNFTGGVCQPHYQAYAHCALEFGNNNLLLGISDYKQGDGHPSGLLLYNNRLLRTARLPFPINEVQFIKKAGTDYYIFASNYSYLYKFSAADVVVDQYDPDYFEIKNIKRFYLPINLFINSFYVTNGGEHIVLGTELGVQIYSFVENGYSLSAEYKKGCSIVAMDGAELENGYAVYLFAYQADNGLNLPAAGGIPPAVSLATITEKDGIFTETECTQSYAALSDLKAIGQNRFLLSGKPEGADVSSLQIATAFYGMEQLSPLLLPFGADMGGKGAVCYFNEKNFLLYGKGLLTVEEEYAVEGGSLEFLVSDPHVEGITGFSFCSQTPAASQPLLTVDYLLTDTPGRGSWQRLPAGGRPLAGGILSLYSYEQVAAARYLQLVVHLARSPDGCYAPSLSELTIIKKEIVRTTSDSLQVKGFIHDATVRNGRGYLTINSKKQELGEAGSFADIIPLDTAQTGRKTQVDLQVTNESGQQAALSFQAEYVKNEPTLGEIRLIHADGQEISLETDKLATDNLAEAEHVPLVVTTADKVSLSGTFSGLYGVQVTASLYTLDSNNRADRFIAPAYGAKFTEVTDVAGERHGRFSIKDMRVLPGSQRIIIKCSNPYGTSREFSFDLEFQVAHEQVEITNYTITDNKLDRVFRIRKNSQYRYEESFELTGRLISNNNTVQEMSFRSDNAYLSFSGGSSHEVKALTVPLNSIDKSFRITVHMKMLDDNERLVERFTLWPASLALKDLKRIISVEFQKEFENILPDFSASRLDPVTGKIRVKFTFRESLPENMLLRLRLNHQPVDPAAEYTLLERGQSSAAITYTAEGYALNSELTAKNGMNVLDWWLFEDKGEPGSFNNEKLLASGDLEFDYTDGEPYTPFSVIFPAGNRVYNSETLKENPVQIISDARGVLVIKLNGETLSLAGAGSGKSKKLDLTTFPSILKEGQNKIEATYQWEAGNIDHYQWDEFQYDSLIPVVKITSLEYEEDATTPRVKAVTAEIIEDNLEKVILVYNHTALNISPSITIADENRFLYRWQGLENLSPSVIPATEQGLYAEATDITGKKGQSQSINSGPYKSFDIQLANALADTKVLNAPGMTAGGTDDIITDFSNYWNEQTSLFDYHLKYETTKLSDAAGHALREDITSRFNKETIFASGRKYLLFELYDPVSAANMDLAYQCQNTLTRGALVTPVSLLEHKELTFIPRLNTKLLGTQNNKSLYSVVEGFRAPDTQHERYTGFAKDVKVYKDNALVIDWLDQNKDQKYEGLKEGDYKSIIVYALTEKARDGVPDILDNGSDSALLTLPEQEDKPILPVIKLVLDNDLVQRVQDIKIYANYLFLICGTDGIVIYDLAKINKKTPAIEWAGSISPALDLQRADVRAYDFIWQGNYLFVALGADGIAVYDAIDITRPAYLRTVRDTRFAPVRMCSAGLACYAASTTGEIVRYTLDTGYGDITAGASCSVESGLSPASRIWMGNGKLHLVPEQGSFIRVYNCNDANINYERELPIHGTNEPGKMGENLFFPCTDMIYSQNPPAGACEFIQGSKPSLGLAVNGFIIYSAGGEEGLQVVVADESGRIEFDNFNDSGFRVRNMSLPPQEITEMDGAEGGVLELPFNVNNTMTAADRIYKTLTPPVLLGPSKKVKVRFKLQGDNPTNSIFRIRLIFREHGALSECYLPATVTDVTGEAAHFIRITPGEWIEKELSLESFDIHEADYLEEVELSHEFNRSRTNEDFRDRCYLDAAAIPSYLAFTLPLSHIALKIDEDPGTIADIRQPMNLINQEMFIPTKSGRAIVALDLRTGNLQQRFNELSANNVYTGESIATYFEADYFQEDERRNRYLIGQCPDDQVLSDTTTVTLARINDYNIKEFNGQFDNYFQRRLAEGVTRFSMSYAHEELGLVQAPEQASYKIYLSDTLVVPPPATGTSRISEKTSKYVLIPRTRNGALSFWLRLEEEIPWFTTYANQADFNTTVAKPLVAWGGETPEEACYRFVVKPRSLAFVKYRAGSPVNKTDQDIEADNILAVDIDNTQAGGFYGRWQLVTLSWHEDGGLTLYVNNKRINSQPFHMKNFDWTKFLHARISFGDAGQDVGSFYFSLAAPRVFNRELNDYDVNTLYTATNTLQGRSTNLEMNFNGNLSITKYTNCEDDITSDHPVYENTQNGQGVIITGGITNYIAENMAEKGLMLTDVFAKSDLIRENTTASYDAAQDTFTLRLTEQSKPGVYHLTDGSANSHGIPGAESYTFYGTLLTTDPGATERCIIKLNGKETVFPLKSGEFQFTCLNSDAVLNSVDLYFETGRDLVFKADSFGFNCGRYRGNNGTSYPANYLHMRHKFYHKESVVLYYAPLFKNAWELNGEEIVIADSRLYRIGIRDNHYYAALKTAEGELTLVSPALLAGGLHQLAILYDFSTGDFRFYLDAALEASYEGPRFGLPPGVVGIFPEVYNLSFGGSLDGNGKQSAQGLFDHFLIFQETIQEKELTDDFLSKTSLIKVEGGPLFGQRNIELTLYNNTTRQIELAYRFDNNAKQPLTLEAGGSKKITGECELGAHMLIMDIDTGEMHKTENYRFVVNYAPMIKLTAATPFIIRGNKQFFFRLDRPLDNMFFNKDKYIVVALYMATDPSGLDSHPVQTIREDRASASPGIYLRDDNPARKRTDILFETAYPFPPEAAQVYYRICAYYYGEENTAYSLSGQIRVLDIEEPAITRYDEINHRPWKVGTGIRNFSGQKDCLKDLRCRYELMRLNDLQEYDMLEEGLSTFNQEGKIEIDVYRHKQPGNYRMVFEPTDEKGGTGIIKDIKYSITGEQVNTVEQIPGVPSIDSLELILIDNDRHEAAYNLQCTVSGLNTTETFRVVVECTSDLPDKRLLLEETVNRTAWQKTILVPALSIGTSYRIQARLIYNGQEIARQAVFTYDSQQVDVKITHGPLGLIGYNNVFFNWQGSLNGARNADLSYQYTIDASAWGYTKENGIAFYNLADGRHRFSLQAFDKTGRVSSGVKSVNFEIDTANPVINEAKLILQEVKDNLSIVTHLKLSAGPGAVTDFSLAGVTVNAQPVPVAADGSFSVPVLPLELDGSNTIEITAFDLLGNTASIKKTYDYTILEISYPVQPADPDKPTADELVKYSPLTVYGRIAKGIPIPENFRITVCDPFGQHTAIINFDRTFFIENVRINPGSEFKGIQTLLTFRTELGNGKTVTRKHAVVAKAVLKPIEFDLSVHAVPGGAATTQVDMQGFCRADNIACWSLDYDGDGVYEDDIYTTEKTISRTHSYSSVGIINPRARVITTDNQIFSWQDTLIIHDKIIRADVAGITGALAVDIIEIDPPDQDTDGFEYAYLLEEEKNYFQIKRYRIDANSAPGIELVDDSSLAINLTQLNINYPRSVKVDRNLNLYVASVYGTGSRLFRLVPCSGGYKVDESFKLVFNNEIISSVALDDRFVYISLENTAELVKYGKDGHLVLRSKPLMNNIVEDTKQDAGLEVAGGRLWLGDYLNTRVISVSTSDFKLRDFFGEPGNKEGQFIHPKIVRVRDNYVFVLDQSEKTLQVFEATGEEYRIVCRIDSTVDYMADGFLNYVTDFTVFTKLENNRRYYYIALVNNAPGLVTLLRIPQWQPDTVRVKSNLIVYIKNNEIFTAKPDGADARKIFSSGALPGVDGNVDFPALAPNGSTIAFVSCIERLEYLTDEESQGFKKYDKLYLINTDGTGCTQITDPAIQDKELDRPQFSYNGSKLVFSAKGKVDRFWTIYEYDRDTKKVSKLFNPGADCRRPTYSPDDRYLAYVTSFYTQHNEIAIFDTENPDRIIYLTNNDYPDDYPVWAPVYSGELPSELKGIKSKIAFVSKPGSKERIYYSYIAQETSEDFRVVKVDGANTKDNPDAARNELINIDYDNLGNISYPCFTSDGQTIIFESYQKGVATLQQYNLKTKKLSLTGAPEGARRPAGMKNRIVNFKAGIVDGNTLAVSWDRYTNEDLSYTVAYRSSEKDAEWAEAETKNQTQAWIKGLKMGLSYEVRVYVKDRLRGGEITTSVIKKVVVYPVAAIPTVEIDANDPYKVRLSAWKPESDKSWEIEWKFKWFIDNEPLLDTFSDFTEYIFSNSGIKHIALEVSLNNEPAKMHRSDDVIVDIKGDLTPRFEYNVVANNDAQVIELDGSTSSGSHIDRNHFRWTISGYNVNNALSQINIQDAVTAIQAIDGFKGDIDVTLTVTGEPSKENKWETKSVTKRIALGVGEITPVIIATESDAGSGAYSFDGSQSIGNIDWSTSRWEVLGPVDDLHPDGAYKRDQGVSAISCLLPERNADAYYRIGLTCRGKSSGKTVTATKVLQVGKIPVLPVIDYKVITSRTPGAGLDADEVVNAKLLLNAASSRGSNIDWNNITWNLPLPGDYGGTSSQKGAAVVYNLYNVSRGMAVDVELTIPRKGTGEISQVHQVITITDGEVPAIEPCIELLKDEKSDLYSTAEGDVYLFSALNSHGPNIDWNNVQWLVDNQYSRQGPIVRLDKTVSNEKNQALVVTLILRSTAGGEPVTKTASFNLKRKEIDIVISQNSKKTYLEAGEHNLVTLSVRNSQGQNIDWERTRWFIYLGPENIKSDLYGAEVVHAFPLGTDTEYYPVAVQMFHKGSTIPFTKNINVQVKGDRLQALIKEEYNLDIAEADRYVRTFTAADSLGENIDWQNCKWTFGDSAEYQYGPVVTHRFPVTKENAFYTVTLTITRRTREDKAEISTDSYIVNMAKDELNAKITVKQEGNYVVFSAEASEGRGLLLDRSMWLFEGADSESKGDGTTNMEYVTKSSHSTITTDNFRVDSGVVIGAEWGSVGPGGATGAKGIFMGHLNLIYDHTVQTNDQEQYLQDKQISQSSNDTSNNLYSGASCRKMINGWQSKRVTLVIYRALPDGTIEAQSKSFIYTAGVATVRVIE